MRRQNILDHYYHWLLNLVCDDYQINLYERLFTALYNTEFTWTVDRDENRAADGIDLRADFSEKEGIDLYQCRKVLDGPCNVLEMMIGLACRCEDSIMGDDDFGDRTPKWFWLMIQNLDLDHMENSRYDDEQVHFAISTFINRTYTRDGQGGLFYIDGCKKDLRKAEIWYQMCWYLNTII